MKIFLLIGPNLHKLHFNNPGDTGNLEGFI